MSLMLSMGFDSLGSQGHIARLRMLWRNGSDCMECHIMFGVWRKMEKNHGQSDCNITLRELREEDAEGMLEWMRDKDIMGNFRFASGDKRRQDVLAFIRSSVNAPEDGKSMHYAITKNGGEYLGTVSLKNLDLNARNAEYAIVLRNKAQGQGLASAATREILRIAFVEVGLERVYLNVLRENQGAIRLYERCGFVYEGEFRNHLFLEGEFRMLKWYGILKEEYEMGVGGGKRC